MISLPRLTEILTEMGCYIYISIENFPSRSLGKNITGQYYCQPDLEIEVYSYSISRSGTGLRLKHKHQINHYQTKMSVNR